MVVYLLYIPHNQTYAYEILLTEGKNPDNLILYPSHPGYFKKNDEYALHKYLDMGVTDGSKILSI